MSDEKESSHTKKLGIDIPLDLDARLKKTVPWGSQAEVFRCLIETFVSSVEDKGGIVLYQLLRGELTLIDTRTVHHINGSDTENGDGRNG